MSTRSMNPPNVPAQNETFLDHTGHFVADADAAAQALSAMGFTVTPYSAQVQPAPDTGDMQLTGTGNICVMLSEGYLEFLVHTADTPIGLEFKRALQRRSGLHLCAFSVADAAARHAELAAAGQAMRPLVNFSREIETASGTATARFTVARLPEETMPEGRVQVMTHHDHAAMWQSRWTAHSNGAQRLLGIVVSSPSPGDTAARFANFAGVTPIARGAGFSIPLARGSVDILTAEDAATLTGQAIEPERSGFVALRIGVENISTMRTFTGTATTGKRDRLVVPFHHTLGPGAWIFEQT